ncbi:MAG: DnaD domain protein [Bacillota bacterium]|nr:DnaD domain protein [Bacillota bacterium]
MASQNGQAVRKYRGGNITAAFSTDLFVQGITFVPSMLLCFYKKMGLSDSEVLLLIHLFRLHSEEGNYYPSKELLGDLVAGGVSQVERDLASLAAKDILGLTEYYDRDRVTTGYDFEPLFERLSELWACSKVEEIEKTQAALGATPRDEMVDREFGRLCEEFAREFGRPLSPIEVEQIEQWAGSVPHALVREALRRAVLLGKHNFKYIDRILLEWTKNNLRTLDQVNEYESRFQKRQAHSRKNEGRSSPRNGDKGSLKSLYV